MSAKRNQQNLNFSGFSPIQREFYFSLNLCKITNQIAQINKQPNQHISTVNTYSPQSIKSPGKDYGINERIEVGREKLLSGYERWKLAEANGSQCLQIIHNIKEKTRRSNESPYPSELEIYCTKLAMVKTVLGEVVKSVTEVKKEISGSISILESISDHEELKHRLKTVEKFLHRLLQLYEKNLELKNFIIGESVPPCL